MVLITGLWLGVPACSAIAADQLPDLIRVRTEGPEMLSVLSYVAYPKEKPRRAGSTGLISVDLSSSSRCRETKGKQRCQERMALPLVLHEVTAI